jgi:hypothetical protein
MNRDQGPPHRVARAPDTQGLRPERQRATFPEPVRLATEARPWGRQNLAAAPVAACHRGSDPARTPCRTDAARLPPGPWEHRAPFESGPREQAHA